LTCAAFACSQVDAGNGRALVVYTSLDAAVAQPVVEAFRSAHPDVPVELVEIDAGLALDRIRAELKNREMTRSRASVWWGADEVSLERAAREGLLDPTAPAWARTLQSELRDSKGHWFGQFLESFCIAYKQNTAALPLQFQNLAEPGYRGRVVLSMPSGSNPASLFLGESLLIRGAPANPRAFDWFWILDGNRGTEYFDGDREILEHLVHHERRENAPADLGVVRVSAAVRARDGDGMPLQWILPADAPGYVLGIAKIAGAPLPDEASQFIEFTGRDEHLSRYLQQGLVPLPLERIEASAIPAWASAVMARALVNDRTVLANQLGEWVGQFESRVRRGAPALPVGEEAGVWWLNFIDIAGTLLIAGVLILLLRRGGWTALRTTREPHNPPPPG
jgi:ABC-type Fe3+ transport system substrate-binding protein